jgi:hypothetical protein
MADDFTLHTGSVLDTVAATRGDIPGLPTGGCTLFSATGYATGGGGAPALASVPPDAKWANSIKCEIGNVVALTLGALDPADNAQMATVLGPIRGILSHATDTGFDTTAHRRMLIAASSCKATGVNSSVDSSLGSAGVASYCMATGAQSKVIASAAVDFGGADLDAAGSRSLIASSCANAGAITTSGSSQSLVAASRTISAAITVSGDQSAVIASDTTLSAVTISGPRSAVIASHSVVIDADTSASIASSIGSIAAGFGNSAMIASSGADINNSRSAAIATNRALIDHHDCVAVASDDPGPSPAIKTVYGGDGGSNTWTIYSASGNATFLGSVIKFGALPAGINAAAAGASAGELWIDTSDGNAVKQA